MVVELRRWLQAYDRHCGQAQDGRIEAWLFKLLAGVIGDRSRDEVQMRMAALVFALADKPAFCFDDRSLRQAMARFKFWPAAKELIDFTAAIEDEMRARAKRAYDCIDVNLRPPAAKEPNWTPALDRPKRTPEELQAVGDICAGIRANLAQATADLTHRKPVNRKPPETAENPEAPHGQAP